MSQKDTIIKFKDVPYFTAQPHTFHKGYFWIFKGKRRVGSYSTKKRLVDIHIKNEWATAKCSSVHQAIRWIFLKLQKPRKLRK